MEKKVILPQPENYVASDGTYLSELYAVAVMRAIGNASAERVIRHYVGKK
jgi:hypothetical protein